jgi:hypothetical protein
MPDFKFACPHCDQHLQCDQRMSGRQIQCPHCNTLIRIPPVPGKTVQYAPESGKTWDTFVGGRAAPSKKYAVGGKKPATKTKPPSRA